MDLDGGFALSLVLFVLMTSVDVGGEETMMLETPSKLLSLLMVELAWSVNTEIDRKSVV